jgi:4a-hydroxytetrahydrobiopterin dehydratase
MDLASEPIVPYTPGEVPLTRREILELLPEVREWSLEDGHLVQRFTGKDFLDCLAFLEECAEFAAREGHYPDISIREGRRVEISWYTIAAGGLTRNDFIMAARLSERIRSRQGGAL